MLSQSTPIQYGAEDDVVCCWLSVMRMIRIKLSHGKLPVGPGESRWWLWWVVVRRVRGWWAVGRRDGIESTCACV